MIDSARSVNLKLSVPVKCYYSGFKKDKSLPFEYYESFSLNNVVYTIQDYAVVHGLIDIEVVKLLCIYKNRERTIQLVVRKYVLARNLRELLEEEGCTKFDDNEVVEDFVQEYTISPNLILRKCFMVYGLRDENYLVSENNLNPLTYFSCRYVLTPSGLSPLLTMPSVLKELNINSNSKSPMRNRKKSVEGNTLAIASNDSSSDENTPESLKNRHKNIKTPSLPNNMPNLRISVKRNLNNSFGDSPGKGNSILNYSIITDEEDDNSLILKLKVSEKNKIPLVVLKKSNESSYSTTLKPNKKETEQQIRKSSRIKVRKSYADYISPIKLTPRKRGISENVSENGEVGSTEGTPVKNYRKKSQLKATLDTLATPAKLSQKNINVVSEKRTIRTPIRYQTREVVSPLVKSARRSLRLTSREEVKENVSFQTSTKSSKRRKSISLDKSDGEMSDASTPEKRFNLNESTRRTVLKSKLQKAEMEERNVGEVNNKRKSRSTKQFFYESSDEESNEESSPEKSLSIRTLHTRSKSMSNQREGTDMPKTGNNYTSSNELPSKTPRRNVSPSTKKSTLRTRSKSINNEEKLIPNNTKTKRLADDSDEDYSPSSDIVPKTPSRTKRRVASPITKDIVRTPRRDSSLAMPKSAVKHTPKTPRNRAKLIREGIITPSMHNRTKAIAGDSTPLMKARSQLHVSYVPSSLPCREKEYCDIFNFLEGKLFDGCGGCMYISGVPGTGKTATVTAVINHLLQSGDIPKFDNVSINGMRLTEPRQSYVEILKQLTNKTVPWEQAQGILEERFTKSKKLAPVIMLIDELDILCTKRQDVVYNLLDWPSKAKSQLIVVTIANTMDLPERLLMSRVTSRLGLTRLTFQAYTHKQLQEIVTKRLTGTDSFNPDAIQFVARKVASVSGDARRALDICRRAAEIAEAEGKGQLVNMTHVNEALNAMITQPKVRAIKNCSRLEQLIMQSIVAEVERTGVEETTLADVYKMLVSCAAIDGFRMVSVTIALSAVSRLSACRLLLTDQKCNNINQRIVLNVSVDDVYYALKKE